MRKNHHGKNDRLVKRVFALCLALAVICTCLVPVFATEDLSDLQVEKGASQPVDGEGGKEEAAGFGGEEAPRPVDDEGGEEEAAGSDGDSPAVDDSEAAGSDGEEASQPVDGEGGEDNPGEGGEDNPGEDAVVDMNEEVVSGDEIKKLQDMVVYRFWLKELKALDLQEIAMKAQTDKMTESEYLARNGEVWSLYFIQAVPRAETIADYSSYIKDPSSDQDPTGMLRLFDHWYTLDELGDQVRLDLSDPTSNILDDKTTTVNVYAAWKDGTVSSDEEEDVVHEDLVDKNPAPPAPVELTATAAATYKGEGDNTESVDPLVKVENLPSAADHLSVSRMDYDSMTEFYNTYVNKLQGMQPLLGLKITPEDINSEKVQLAKGQKATVTVSGLNKLPEIVAMEKAGALNAKALKVLHETSDGNVEILDVLTYTNGTLTFETNSFSPFVVALAGGYDTELLDERAADSYAPLYLYALKPGLEWNGNQTSSNEYWYGIGIAKIKGNPGATRNTGTIQSYIDDSIIDLNPFTGKYRFGSWYNGTTNDYGSGKALYPKIGLDKKTVVGANDKGYIYWDRGGAAPEEPYYTVEWINLGLPSGAPASDNGYNEPEVSYRYSVYHLDALIKFNDMYNVHFAVRNPGKMEFERLDVMKYSGAYEKNSSENQIVLPEKNTKAPYDTKQYENQGYVFDGWYKDEDCTQIAEFNGTIDSDKIYYGKYIPGGDQLKPDIAYLKVEKKVTGITEAEMNPQFKVTMSGNGITHDLTLGGSTTILQSDGSFVLRWTVPDMKPGSYTIEESGTEVANYTCNASGMVGKNVNVQANTFTVQADSKDVITSCANEVFPIGEESGQNRIFVVSSTGNFNVVVSLKPLSLSEKTSVISALKNLNGNGSTFANQADNTKFYSINAANSERIQINSTILSYDSGAKTVTVVYKGGWNKALKLNYNVQEANNPEVKITNAYTPATANVTLTKQVTGLMGDTHKDFEFSITGLDGKGVTLENGDLSNFTLTHNGSVTLNNVPMNTVFAVEETLGADSGYETKATGHDTFVADASRTFYYKLVLENGKQVLMACDAEGGEAKAQDELAITVTNHCDLEPDTGVLLDTLPYIVILAVVAGGVALLMLRKRRKEDD